MSEPTPAPPPTIIPADTVGKDSGKPSGKPAVKDFGKVPEPQLTKGEKHIREPAVDPIGAVRPMRLLRRLQEFLAPTDDWTDDWTIGIG